MPDSVNEYAVIVADKESVLRDGEMCEEFRTPAWWEYEFSPIRFNHRYDDDEVICLMKALQAVTAYNKDHKDSNNN